MAKIRMPLSWWLIAGGFVVIYGAGIAATFTRSHWLSLTLGFTYVVTMTFVIGVITGVALALKTKRAAVARTIATVLDEAVF